jgi:hypothetical protein
MLSLQKNNRIRALSSLFKTSGSALFYYLTKEKIERLYSICQTRNRTIIF